GAAIEARTFVESGETIKANGRTYTAGKNGINFVTRASLREVSLVTLGADKATSVSIKGKGSSMFDEFVKAKGFDPDNLSDSQRASLQAWYEREHPPTTLKEQVDILIARYTEDRPAFVAEAEQIVDRGLKARKPLNEIELELLRASRPRGGFSV